MQLVRTGSFSRNSSETSDKTKCDTAFTQGLGSTFQLGSDYERKKHKLLQELQLDYKDYVAKKNNLKTHEPDSHQQGLSLPINERASIKERLREERNKEYNLFLQERAQKRGLKRGTPPVTSKLEHLQALDAANKTSQSPPLPFLNTQTSVLPPRQERPACRRDAATLTEAGNDGGGAWNLDPRRRRRWRIPKPRELHSSEGEPCTDEEEDFGFRHRRRRDGHPREPQPRDEKGTQKRRVDRAFWDTKEPEAPVLPDQDDKDGLWKSDSKHIPDSMRTAARSPAATCKDKAESATGLMIGATEEQTITQMRKEQYKQELLRQIAEQQRNKIKEKKLELKVAATGATDPEKQPDRIKQFRTAYQQYENLRQDAPHKSGADLEAVGKDPNPRLKGEIHHRAPGGSSQVDFNTTLSQLPGWTGPGPGMGAEHDVPPFDYFTEDYHRNFARTPGGVALPRNASVAPPMLPNIYKTPQESAHHYYRTRNPLESQDNLHDGPQHFGNFETPPQWTSPVRANKGSPFAAEGLHADKQRRESVLRYQEALKQQIQEREERKRREKEEKERSDAKSEAEMMTYDPWGRSGGGAPIKDQHGNLVSDLKQMHIINKNRLLSPRAGAASPFQLPGSCHQSPQQPPLTQDRYKEELKQQIEENRRKRAEERERQTLAAEEEEKRLAKERARMLQQYEEEQRKQREAHSYAKKKRQVHEALMQPTEEVKNRKQKNQTVPHSAKEREEKTSQLTYQREPSPPIPTLQKKHKNPAASKPPSVERSVSAPHVQPVPRHLPTLREDQREVIKGLSALRDYLQKEQRRLERTGHSHLGRRRLRAFEAANKESVQPLPRSPSVNAEKQNNRLQNGDGLDYQPSHYYPRRKPACFVPRNVSLPFEMAFADEGQVNLQRGPQPSEERSQRKQAVADSLDGREPSGQPGDRSLKPREAKCWRRDSERGDYSRTGSGLRRPVSVGTVAAEL
ncbi:centrosome and spindle pole-associated protein 1 isoform X2 [Kryptolebias marmoratus]|uniref:centrosome and spindle pole-associated protein 1 isoform X2 n=1 Tax=Kryptolebias marmoratus TaxID=37003 RepID=UPI0007F8DC41|nr:centrosome and spindle pole-associated protein 1 isoform X2 [Kryptolebias marmoratus]